jgi:5,10-methylenetetrahydrofolate reductase
MKLKDALKKKQFVVTSEIQAPIDQEPEDLVQSLSRVRGRVDGVSLSEVEFEGVVGDTIKTCRLLDQNQFEPIYQTTTRDKNRLQLQKDLVEAHEAGIENLLVFTEDYRITGDSLQEMMFFHVDAGKLQSVLQHIKEGQTVEGDSLQSKADFLVGSGVESAWGKNVPDLEMKEMEEMTNLGTGYFLTTPIFDVDQFAKFIKRVDTFQVPVIAEVMILRTAGMGRNPGWCRSGSFKNWPRPLTSKKPAPKYLRISSAP